MEHHSILIVDDEPIVRHTLQQDLLDQGYLVDTVEGGESALQKLGKQEYSLIITDLIMGEMNGLDLLDVIKQKIPDQAVFILTGYGRLESAIAALRLGATDYLLKPYDYDEMILRVGRCLTMQKMEKTLKIYENLLSICSECKKIRDDVSDTEGKGENWISIEQYLSNTTGSEFSHGICPECYKKKLEELDLFIKYTKPGTGKV
jgi:DNA-binding NtrC family response regulator